MSMDATKVRQRLDGSTVAIVGLGLLGASLALGLRRTAPAVRLLGWARRRETVAAALTAGIIDEGSDDPAQILPRADLTVLCVPLQPTIDFARAHASLWRPGSLVTDIGSTKEAIVAAVRPALAAAGVHFIGSHPMAGSHHTGLEHADAGLYQGAIVFVTPQKGDQADESEFLEGMWRSVGGEPYRISPAEHDSLVARTSHALHLVAAAAVRSYLGRDKSDLATGGAFRDFSRIAASSPDMWTEISMFNRHRLVAALKELELEIAKVRTLVELEDWTALYAYLDLAREQRESWFAEWSRRKQPR